MSRSNADQQGILESVDPRQVVYCSCILLILISCANPPLEMDPPQNYLSISKIYILPAFVYWRQWCNDFWHRSFVKRSACCVGFWANFRNLGLTLKKMNCQHWQRNDPMWTLRPCCESDSNMHWSHLSILRFQTKLISRLGRYSREYGSYLEDGQWDFIKSLSQTLFRHIPADPMSNPVIYYIKWVVSESIGGFNAVAAEIDDAKIFWVFVQL